MVKVAPSILAADFDNLEKEIENVVDAGADMIHVDVMDGEFVDNETPGLEMYEKARKTTKKLIDTHLMVENPENWIDDFLLSNSISFHIEAVDEETADRIIDKLHEHEIKASIALKPGTPVDEIKPFLDKLDMVLIMTVEPGFGGQQMIQDCLEKVKIIRKLNPDIDIEVDGGITTDTALKAKEAGANVLVAGTAIFKEKEKRRIIEELKK